MNLAKRPHIIHATIGGTTRYWEPTGWTDRKRARRYKKPEAVAIAQQMIARRLKGVNVEAV